MEEILEYYNNNIPEEFLQQIIKEEMTIISKIKAHESITEEQYIQDYIKNHPNMTVGEFKLWKNIIEDSFKYGLFYYKTEKQHDIYLNGGDK